MNQDEFTVTVVIPCYNMGALLPRAVQSVCDQTVQPLEIVVVDDGSTDHTREVLERLSQDIPMLRFVSQNNQGNAGAKNTGIEAAKGKWIGLLDADDVWLNDKLESQIELLQRHPDLQWVAGVYHRARYTHDGQMIVVETSPVDDAIRSSGDGAYEALSMIEGPTSVWVGTMLARRSAFQEHGGFNPQLLGCDDSDLWVRFALRYTRIGFVSRPIAVYTVAQSQSLTGIAARQIEPSRYEQMLRLVRFRDESTDQRERSLLASILQQNVTGYMSNLLRTGSTSAAREYVAELRRLGLPLPPLIGRLLSRFPQSLARPLRATYLSFRTIQRSTKELSKKGVR